MRYCFKMNYKIELSLEMLFCSRVEQVMNRAK